MSGSTLIIERHEWRGFKTVGGELGIARTFGFWTVTYCPFLLSAWLEGKMDLMRSVLRSSDTRARNAPNTGQSVNPSQKFQPPKHVTTKTQGSK